MRKPRSRWRERARAWEKRGHLPLRPWSRTPVRCWYATLCWNRYGAPRFSEEGGSTVPSRRRGGPVRWRPRESYRAGAAAAAETAAAAGAATTWACAPPTRGGRRGHRPRRTSTRTSPACGGCTVRMLCRRRGREAASSRRCRGRHRRPAPRRASPALGLSITVIGSSRVATRPSISAYIALQYDTLNSSQRSSILTLCLHQYNRVCGVLDDRSRKNGIKGT